MISEARKKVLFFLIFSLPPLNKLPPKQSPQVRINILLHWKPRAVFTICPCSTILNLLAPLIYSFRELFRSADLSLSTLKRQKVNYHLLFTRKCKKLTILKKTRELFCCYQDDILYSTISVKPY